MMTLGEKIQRWKEKGKDYDDGLEIYLRYGPKNVNIARILQSPRRSRKQDERLDWELEKMSRSLGHTTPPRVRSKLKPKQKETQSEEAPAPPEPPKNKIEAIAVEVFGKVPRTTTVDELSVKIRRLYNKRARLSNQLAKDEGKAKVVEKNCELLEQIAEIMAQMKELEAQKRQLLEQGQDHTRPKAPIVVRTRDLAYTLQGLMELSNPELRKIKRYLTQDIKNKQTSVRTNRSEKMRSKNEKLLALKVKMLEVVERLLLDQKISQNAKA